MERRKFVKLAFLQDVFILNCHLSLILDGEMVAYDPNSDTFLPFGTLKTAASSKCFIVL
jgi:ATP-dependent DNA ligase